MVAVYFSHSYRQPDQKINDHFLRLMKHRGIISRVDVKSENRLNAAKLERQLSFTAGLICVLPEREGGPSAYIQAEIMMALRTQKPTLIFCEDTLPEQAMPGRVIQDRFSRSSYWRDVPEQIERIEAFRRLTGPRLRPRIRNLDKRRSIYLLGADTLAEALVHSIDELIERRRYAVARSGAMPLVEQSEAYAELLDSHLVLAFLDRLSPKETYLLGYARASGIPTMMFTFESECRMFGNLPAELGARCLSNILELDIEAIDKQIDIFEDEAYEMDQEDEIAAYVDFTTKSSDPRSYDDEQRAIFIQNNQQTQLNRDNYNFKTAGAVGEGATNVQKGEGE